MQSIAINFFFLLLDRENLIQGGKLKVSSAAEFEVYHIHL